MDLTISILTPPNGISYLSHSHPSNWFLLSRFFVPGISRKFSAVCHVFFKAAELRKWIFASDSSEIVWGPGRWIVGSSLWGARLGTEPIVITGGDMGKWPAMKWVTGFFFTPISGVVSP